MQDIQNTAMSNNNNNILIESVNDDDDDVTLKLVEVTSVKILHAREREREQDKEQIIKGEHSIENERFYYIPQQQQQQQHEQIQSMSNSNYIQNVENYHHHNNNQPQLLSGLGKKLLYFTLLYFTVSTIRNGYEFLKELLFF